MIYNLIPEDSPILTQRIESFNFANPPIDPIELADNMSATLEKHFGLGLSANQVGLPYRMFIMRGETNNIAVFNPRIVSVSNEVISLEEACLSFPGLNLKIKRPRTIRVRYQNEYGETNTHTYTNMTARIFLHEYDHLEGVLFFNRANRYHKEQAFKKRKK
jgi:peptide deformylase